MLQVFVGVTLSLSVAHPCGIISSLEELDYKPPSSFVGRNP